MISPRTMDIAIFWLSCQSASVVNPVWPVQVVDNTDSRTLKMHSGSPKVTDISNSQKLMQLPINTLM